MAPPDYDAIIQQFRPSPGPVRRVATRAWAWIRGFMTPDPRGVSAEEIPELLSVAAMRLPQRSKPRVVLVIGSLSAGGAERQLVAFAASSRAQDLIEPVVLLSFEPEGAAGHYAAPLRAAGVTIEVAGRSTDREVVRTLKRDRRLAARLASLPPVIRAHVVEMAGELLRLRPDCVHAWLDHSNIWAGVAALAVGVPHLVLSTRNVNPTHFPYLSQPWFLEWYRLLVRSPRVTMINNSFPGADDYAAWLGIGRERIQVVLNGVDPAWISRPDQAAVAALREDIAGRHALIVGGVFRLSAEKQPFAWLAVARRIVSQRPDVAFFHAGEGPLDGEFRSASADLVASGKLKVLGRRSDVPALLSASDVLLHAARFEGTPNVLLEASHLGCPIVSTRAGGAVDVVEDGVTGFLCDPSDIEGLAARLGALLGDPACRHRLSSAGPRRVAERFSLETMVEGTLACYPMLRDRPPS